MAAGQRILDFDLGELMGRIRRANVTTNERKLLSAIAVWGQSNRHRIAPSDDEQEWLVNPSLSDLARAAGAHRNTVRNWINRTVDSPFLEITRNDDSEHDFLVSWSRLPVVPAQTESCTGTKTVPVGRSKLVRAQVDSAKTGTVRANQDQNKKNLHHHQNQPKAAAQQQRQDGRTLGITITARDFSGPAGFRRLFEAARSQGFLRSDDAEEFLALWRWMRRNPAKVANRGGFLLYLLRGGRKEWTTRPDEEDRQWAARQRRSEPTTGEG